MCEWTHKHRLQQYWSSPPRGRASRGYSGHSASQDEFFENLKKEAIEAGMNELLKRRP